MSDDNLTDIERQALLGFLGFGNPVAPVVLLRMEEGLAETLGHLLLKQLRDRERWSLTYASRSCTPIMPTASAAPKRWRRRARSEKHLLRLAKENKAWATRPLRGFAKTRALQMETERLQRLTKHRQPGEDAFATHNVEFTDTEGEDDCCPGGSTEYDSKRKTDRRVGVRLSFAPRPGKGPRDSQLPGE